MSDRVCSGSYVPRSILRLTLEKSKGLCRQIALPQPADAILLQILSNTLWNEIKAKAPCDTAFYAPHDQPFSKKNAEEDESEWGYGPVESWMDFQEEILKFSQNRDYVVITDIANYYDFIVHSHLRNILSEYGLERELALDLLLFILDATLWRPDYMPNLGIGLPQMELDAPRLLAHTHLFEIDSMYASDADVDYARYMDDIDFGVDTIAKAKTVLRDLDLALQTRNLRVNSGKTKILTSLQAYSHFKIAENNFVDRLQSKIAEAKAKGNSLQVYGEVVIRGLRYGKGKPLFEEGNGDKIIKRLLTLLKMTGAQVPDDVFRWILYEKPGLRRNLFTTWSATGVSSQHIDRLAGFLLSGEAIDDIVYISSIVSLSHSLHQVRLKNAQFSFLRYALKDGIASHLFSRLMLVSRFDTPSLLWSEIKSSVDVWSRDCYLSRQVAGFAPLIYQTSNWSEFCSLVDRWGGEDAHSVLDFHEFLRSDATYYKRVKAFLQAPSPSAGTLITHSKLLMILSVIQNDNISKLERAKIVGTHSYMMNDVYYNSLFSSALSSMK